MRRSVAAVTGSRADFGLLYWTLHELDRSAEFDLSIIVTGSHLDPRFGDSLAEIRFSEDTKILHAPILNGEDSPLGSARAASRAVDSIATKLAEVQPELLLVLGDRYEALAAGFAANLLSIPVAHIHGGEITEGAQDDAFRNALTQLASLHLVTAQLHFDRVVAMGKPPARVFNLGAPGLENLRRLSLLDRPALEAKFEFTWGDHPLAVLTFHPVTREPGNSVPTLGSIFSAIENFRELRVVMTSPNADAEGLELLKLCESFSRAHPERVLFRRSLGQVAYLSFLKQAQLVMGNSSSAIIEAPALHIPSIDIGNRQKGRLAAPSVIRCDSNARAIEAAIDLALSGDYKKITAEAKNPYGNGEFSMKIISVLKTTNPKTL